MYKYMFMYIVKLYDYVQVVRVLLEAGANVEDHNENGHTPLMEAASAGHCGVAKILLEFGAGINTHSNEFKVDTVNFYRIFRVKVSSNQKLASFRPSSHSFNCIILD